ncbi:MAG: zinc ribbon domain-containing protein [Pseudomonadota bacterium]|nr:zinc ribbon domain-containing protein [Pseudomonadota bacterium]
MPIYEYKCKKCGKDFEMFQRITDPAITSCRFCKGPVTKLMSLSSFHLKGSGWYVTDYGGAKAPHSEAKREASATAGTEKVESAASDDAKASE